MNAKILAIAAVLVLGIAGVATVVLMEPGGDSDRVDYRSEETVIDFVGREVPIPTSLDGGIITIGTLNVVRWLAYFPNEFEHLKMVDFSIAVKNQGSLAFSHAYGDILTDIDTHSNNSLEELEKMNHANPSLILVNDSVYSSHKNECDKLAVLNPLAVIDTMSNMETTGFWDDEYQLHNRFVDQADLYGKLLSNQNRADEVKVFFQDALNDIRDCIGESSDNVTYVGGPVNQGGNPLTSTFNPYIPHALVGGVNALGENTNPTRIDQTPEEFGKLAFNHMLIEPSTVTPNKEGGNLLVNVKSQGALMRVYEWNDDEPESVKLFIILPMISHSANWLCVLTSAYHLAYLEYGLITMEDVREKANSLFTNFYGEVRGSGVLEGIEKHFRDLGGTIHEDLCTELFSEVKVEKTSDGEYIFVKA